MDILEVAKFIKRPDIMIIAEQPFINRCDSFCLSIRHFTITIGIETGNTYPLDNIIFE